MRTCENPLKTFPNKKRINTELFIDRTATVDTNETLIRVATTRRTINQRVLAERRSKYPSHIHDIVISKGVAMKDQVSTYLEMSFNRNTVNRTSTLKHCESEINKKSLI